MQKRTFNQDHGKPAQWFRQKVSAVDQRFQANALRSPSDLNRRIKSVSFPDRHQCADNARQNRSGRRGYKSSPKRNRSDHCPVGRNGSAEHQRQHHRRSAGHRGGKEQKRDRGKHGPAAAEQRKRQQQKTRKFPVRFPKRRHREQRQRRINCADKTDTDGRRKRKSDAEPRSRKQEYAEIHQRIVKQKRFDRDLHATRITMTVMSSEPPFCFASVSSRSPAVFGSDSSSASIVCAVPPGKAS